MRRRSLAALLLAAALTVGVAGPADAHGRRHRDRHDHHDRRSGCVFRSSFGGLVDFDFLCPYHRWR